MDPEVTEMRVPVPTNKLVAFTLVGALLTAAVAGVLAAPFAGLGGGDGVEQPQTADENVSEQLGPDAPTPNQEFSPAVQQSSYGEHEEYEDEDEYENEEEHEEEYEDDEYEDE